MLKIVIYAYMNQIYPSRGIEKICKKDISFMYLLARSFDQAHSTIAKFIIIHFAPINKYTIVNLINYLADISFKYFKIIAYAYIIKKSSICKDR